jgi:hypothetical protein
MTINQKSFRARHGLSVGDDTSVVDTVNNSGNWTGVTVNPDRGGTGLSSMSAGDILYGVNVSTPSAGTTSAQVLSKLNIGVSGKILQSNGSAPTWTSSKYPGTASTTAGTVLRSDGTDYINSVLVLPNSIGQYSLLVGATSNAYTTELTTTADRILVAAPTTGAPTWSSTLPAHSVNTSVTVPTIYGQSATGGILTLRANSSDATSGTVAITTTTSSTSTTTGALTVSGGVGIAGKLYVGDTISSTVSVALTGTTNNIGTVTTGVWSGTIITLAKGGTNSNLIASNGGIVYSSDASMAILSGTATANKLLVSGVNSTPAWSTATYPVTVAAAGKMIVSTAADVFGVTTAAYPISSGAVGTILRSDGANITNTSFTVPSTVAAKSIFYASALNVFSPTTNITWDESVLNLGPNVLIKINSAATLANTFLSVNGNNNGLEYRTFVGGFGIDITSGSGTLTISQSGSIAGQTVPNASTFGTFKVGQNLLVGAVSAAVSKIVTGVTWSSLNGGTATYTSASHGLTNGASVIISGIIVGGSTLNTYNGVYTVGNVSSTTFDINIGVNPGSYTSGGSIYYSLGNIDSTNVLDIRVGAGTNISNLISAYSTNNQATKVFNVSTTGQITASDKPLFTKTDANNSSSVAVSKFTHSTSGSPSSGIGTIVELETQTTAGNKVGSNIESIATIVSSGTEEFEFRINNVNSGALAPNLIAKANIISGSNTASYNLIITPSTHSSNGVITIKDKYTNITAGNATLSTGTTLSNVVIDTITHASCRTVKYIMQLTQGANFETKEILVMHNGATPVWTEHSYMAIGTISGGLTYDFVISGADLQFRVSSSGPVISTVVILQKIAISQ